MRIEPGEDAAASGAGIVDQQDAALEKLDDDGAAREEAAAENGPDVGPMADDPMEGEAPSG